jgi:GT2 family glycosyltransferase
MESSSDKTKTAIIVLNWNGFSDTVECLNSLRRQKYDRFSIVLVDNASGDQEASRLKEMFPEIHLIENKVNRGFAGGNNDGMNWALAAGHEYIVNLNNDCIVEEDWLINLIEGLESSGSDFASSRIMYYPEKHLICSNGDALLLDGAGKSVNHLKPYSGEEGALEIFAACGAGSIYSARCLNDIRIKGNQFFDELYFAYYEDIDLGIRLQTKGHKGVSVPGAVVYHKGMQASGYHSFFHRFQIEKNRLLNEILNYPAWLILAGEIFHFLMLALYVIPYFFGKNKVASRPSKGLSAARAFSTMLKARIWIARNLKEVLEDRRERKARGFISARICGDFYWNFRTILDI